MGISTRAAGWAAALTLAFTLTGCGPTGAEEPAELTDEQAYELAVGTYAEYVSLSGQILANDEFSLDSLVAVLSGEELTQEIDAFQKTRDAGYRILGNIGIRGERLIERRDVVGQTSEIDVGVCVDYSNAYRIDAEGREAPVLSNATSVSKRVTIRIDARVGSGHIIHQQNAGDFCA
jgi:hypothetical protein